VLNSGRWPVLAGHDCPAKHDAAHEHRQTPATLACEAHQASREVINVACGERTSLNELVAMLQRVLSVAVVPRCESARPVDVKHSLADISWAAMLLGYQPVVSLLGDGQARFGDVDICCYIGSARGRDGGALRSAVRVRPECRPTLPSPLPYLTARRESTYASPSGVYFAPLGRVAQPVHIHTR